MASRDVVTGTWSVRTAFDRGTARMKHWIIIATVLSQDGWIEELPTRQFDDVRACRDRRAEIVVAYDRMIAHEQALADRRCAGSYVRDRCSDEEFRHAVPWILLGNPRCIEVPTQ
jgi:hypothetical protein